MLQCGGHLLQDALTKRTVEAGNERMATPLTAAQVNNHCCLKFIVPRLHFRSKLMINHSLNSIIKHELY